MPDQFDVQRHLDGAAEDLAEETMDRLTESRELTEERDEPTVGMNEEQARLSGFRPVEGSLFWNADEKKLYVSRGGRYVLYALNRRKIAGARNPERRRV